MFELPRPRLLQRNVDVGICQHSAQTAWTNASPYLGADHAGDAKRPDLESGNGLVQPRIVERYAEEVWRLFFFLFVALCVLIRRGEQFHCLPNCIRRVGVSEVANKTFGNNCLANIRRRDHLSGSELLKTRRGVGDVCAADCLSQQFAVRPHERAEAHIGFNVNDTLNGGDLFNAVVIENTCCRSTTLASLAFVGVAGGALESGKTTEPAPEHLDLIEKVERFETREDVALEPKTERDHGDDHSDADDDSHRR